MELDDADLAVVSLSDERERQNALRATSCRYPVDPEG